MSTPKNFVPTTKNIAPFQRPSVSAFIDKNGIITSFNIESTLKFGQDNGCTYTFPLVDLPPRQFDNNPDYAQLMEGSKDIIKAVQMLKALGEGKRATQPFVFNGDKIYFFLEDGLGTTYQPQLVGRYLNNWLVVGASGYLFNPWAIGAGVCAYHDVWGKTIRVAQSNGVTLDYVFMDLEGTQISTGTSTTDRDGNVYNDTRKQLAIVGSTYYSEPWQGLSSWKFYFEKAGGFSLFGLNGVSYFDFGGSNEIPWRNASDRYLARMMNIANFDYIKTYFPNVFLSNYGNARLDGFTGTENTYFDYSSEQIGNAFSAVLYTTAGPSSLEGTGTKYVIQEDDPRSKLIPLNLVTGTKNRFTLAGPRLSFLKAIQEVKERKRNSYNFPGHHWIGPVNYWTEGYNGTVWTIGSASQSDANVLENSWNKENILSINRGITALDGSTNAFAIRTSETNGVCFSLDYFLIGTTVGATYTFSYYIDLSRGFTSPYFKIQNWKMYYPYDTAGQGLTYRQILPVIGSQIFKEGLVGFTTGNSGWTKVAFQFIGTTNPYLALTSFYGKNSSSLGFTSYIWNPALEIEYSGGITSSIGITNYDARRYEVSSVCPDIAFADGIKGYNPKLDAYFTRRSGNSAYYYELLRHLMLLGTQSFGYFNPSMFIDYSLGDGIIRALGDESTTIAYQTASPIYWYNGGTQHTQILKLFNECIDEVNNKIGGFTTATAFSGWENWLTNYVINGAPGLNGTTWWWRITALPGATVYCNGETLSAYGNIGTWASTTGPSIEGISITTSKWSVPPEPGITTPLKDFNFAQMSTLNDLINAGFTFSRGSTASYFNSQGKLTFAASGQPRFAYDPNSLEPKGLMLEPPATNLLNWSESFSVSGGCNNNWIDVNIARSSGHTSPSDSLNAIKFTATGTNGLLITSSLSGTTLSKAFSFWLKGETGNEDLYYTFDGGTSWSPIPNISTVWKRHEFGVFTADGQVGFKIGNTSESAYIWGAQLETRKDTSFYEMLPPVQVDSLWYNYLNLATSYIKSEAIRGTRSEDRCSLRGTSFSSWFGITYGTFMYEAFGFNDPQSFALTNNLNGNQSMRLSPRSSERIRYQAQGGVSFAFFKDSAQDILFPYYGMSRDTVYKFGLSYEPKKVILTGERTIDFVFNNDFQSLHPSINRLDLMITNTGQSILDYPCDTVYIKRLRYWNFAIPEKLLSLLTIGDHELVAVDDSINYTWEQYNNILNEYGFNKYYGSYLT